MARDVWRPCRLKRTDDEVDDELSKQIDIQSDHGGGESSTKPLEGTTSHAGHDGPQVATPRDESRSSSAT